MSKAVSLLVCLCLGALGLYGQALTSLNGTVADQTGAVVAGASVRLQNLDTGASRETLTDDEGRYIFPQIQPGRYKLTARKEGFREKVVSEFNLLVNQPATVNVDLEVGALTETVSVSAEAVQVNSTDATLGNVIVFDSIVQLPSFARNVAGLLALQPGVTFVGDATDFRSGAVNGGKADQSNITLDGIDINDQQNRYALVGVLRVTPDSVQEFRSTTLNANADQGRSSGAQVNMVTRSGSNDLHGALYDYHRNTVTAANTFFNNLSGVKKGALLIDVFGAAIGGPIKRNKAFFFANYEGRRDRSAVGVLRIVPSLELRQGIVKYLNTAGGVTSLTPEDLKTRVDPAGIGVNQAVLNLFKTFPAPNDFTQGDQLNRQGFRFNAGRKTKQDTYSARLDYILDASNKHNLFWRGNLQNDHLGGVPQYPGDPPRTVDLSNSKGMALGYNAVLRPNLVSTTRFGFTRQGNETAGIQAASAVSFRNFDDRYALTRSETVIVPVYNITQDFSWTKSSHNIQVGGVLRFINNRRSNTNSSFHAASTNVSWLRGTGVEFQRNITDLSGSATPFRDAVMAVLGIVSQVNANYNYTIDGSVLPVGAAVGRRFRGEEYEMYGQDTWRASRALTVTVGLRYSLMPPVYEADGIQTSAVPRLGDWFDLRGSLADQGRSQAEAGNIKFVLHNSPEGHPLYPYHKKNFAPRVGLAYSPQGNDGLSRWLFGGPGRTSVRAGFGMFYDIFGQGVMRLVADNAFGFKTLIRNPSGSQTALTAPRFTGVYDIPTQLLTPAPKGGFPVTAPFLDIGPGGLDDNLQPPYSMTMNFSIGREFSGGWFVEGSYVGRLSRKSLIQRDLAMPTNLRDPSSGMTYFEAASQLVQLRRAKVPTASAPKIAFWENFFPGAASAGKTATQAIYDAYKQYPNDETSGLYDLDYFCDPSCSKFGKYSMFNSQYSALAAWSSIAGGSYHSMQWSARKRFRGYWLNLNYTFSKSIDLASRPERSDAYSGFLVNSWSPGLLKAVSDYDSKHIFNVGGFAELPFGKGKSILGGTNRVVDAIVGGWQLSGIWRWSSGLPTGVGTGRVWPTNWNITSFATPTGPVPETHTTRNAPAVSGKPGANMFSDPKAALAAFDFTLPGGVGLRNDLRGDGVFNVDLGLAKRFRIRERHSLQFRAEAFNVGNNVRFEPRTANIDLGDQANFGKYTGLLVGPRQMQFALRYEF